MKTCGALLVLLCCCLGDTRKGETISDNDIIHQGHYGEAESRENGVMGAAQRTEAADTASTQQTCQPDIHTVLREMSALVAEQRVELRYTKTQMDAVEARLTASEKTVEEQRVELRYTKTQVDAVEARLTASEKTVEEQRVELRQTEARLTASEKLVEQIQSENEVRTVSVNVTARQVEELRREREERRVSFSASLLASGTGHTGPSAFANPLIFRHVLTNIGNGYNPNTGVFTAPVRGVYHFFVFIHAVGHPNTPSAASLNKNAEHVVMTYCHQTSHSETSSTGASLLLEVGDVVYVKLWPNARVYDDPNHHTIFSGHLLFHM